MTSPIIIGIDPDSKKHGVSIFRGHKLIDLRSLQLVDFISLASEFDIAEAHIENVCANNSAFNKKFVKTARAASAISRTLGMCQQSQLELERMLTHLSIKFYHHGISKNWKDATTGKRTLKTHFGWHKSSNEDTRSAAYFGYRGVKQWHTINTTNQE